MVRQSSWQILVSLEHLASQLRHILMRSLHYGIGAQKFYSHPNIMPLVLTFGPQAAFLQKCFRRSLYLSVTPRQTRYSRYLEFLVLLMRIIGPTVSNLVILSLPSPSFEESQWHLIHQALVRQKLTCSKDWQHQIQTKEFRRRWHCFTHTLTHLIDLSFPSHMKKSCIEKNVFFS